MIQNLPTRFSLSEYPSPIHYLSELTCHYGGPRIYMKRDDLLSLGMGGNKIRKLEFLIAEALDQGKDALVTAGGVQSNHCRLTAAAARRAVLDCHLVLSGTPPETANGNLLLDQLFGAAIHFCDRKNRDETLHRVGEALAVSGKNPYIIPVGGSTGTGALGYVNAMDELQLQLKQMNIRPDAVVFASSSGGTQAGMALGARLTGFEGQILGISIDQTKIGTDSFLPVLARIAQEAAEKLGSDMHLQESDFTLNCDYLGAGYAVPGDLELNAIRDLCRYEGILLGPVYTARAMGGLLDMIEKGVFEKDQTVLFWHTGGAPEIFAWSGFFQNSKQFLE